MSKTVLILFAACVGLTLLSLHLVRQMRAGQATIAELQAQVAKLEREQPSPAPPPPTAVQPEPVAPPPPVAPPKDVVTGMSLKRVPTPLPANATFAAGPSVEERLRMVREASERQHKLMQDPEYREALRVQQRSALSRQYPGLAGELGLTAEQTEQLFDLLADQQLRNQDQSEVFWDTEGVDPATLQQRQEKMQQRWMETQRKNEAELAAQLGAGKLQAWKEYQSTLGARHQAEHLRNSLASRGVPLDAEASRAVMKAYAESQKLEMQEYANMARTNGAPAGKTGLVAFQRLEPSSELYERQIEHTRKRNQRVLDALSPFLTYEQREALQKEQEAELKMQEAHMRIMRAQSQLDGANDGANYGSGTGNAVQSVLIPAHD